MAYLHGGLDRDTADRLLSGRMGPDDAPPGFRAVAQLLRDARSDVANDEDLRDEGLVAAMVDAIAAPGGGSERKRMLAKVMTVKAAAIAVVALTATGAAAANGNLGEAAQNGLARAAQHVGINLPTTADDHARDNTDEIGPPPRDSERPAAPNESTADDASSSGDADLPAGDTPGAPEATPNSAAGENHGAVVSDTAQTADPEGGKGEEVAPVAQDNHGVEARAEHQPENAGPPASVPSGGGNDNGNGAETGNGADPPANENASPPGRP